MMIDVTETNANREKLALLHRSMSAALDQVLQRGFHGSASFELAIQDGTIQFVRSKVEQIHRA